MPNVTQRYEAKQKKETIGMLKSLLKKIEKGEFVIKSKGWWQGVAGNYTFRVDVKDSEILEDLE